jgi:hypothetical protein
VTPSARAENPAHKKPNGRAAAEAAEEAARFAANERAKCLERDLLGCLLENPAAWEQITNLSSNDFLFSDHSKIFAAISRLHGNKKDADLSSVVIELSGSGVDAAYVGGLVDGTVRPNFPSYVRGVREESRWRQFRRIQEKLNSATGDKRTLFIPELLKVLQEISQPAVDQDWRAIFHSCQEFENAPPLTFAINGFLQESGVTLIGGLAGHGKTLIMLSMVKALLEQSPLFGHSPFSVPRPAPRVIYLIPECSLGPFWSRIKMFHLEEFACQDNLLIRTLSAREQVELTDPRMLTAVEGADVFLDSVIRFTTGSENDAENIRLFSDVLFKLLHAGARTITGCHHSPKSFETAQSMTLGNILRGSGDLGAMICTCWGVRQIDAARNRIYVENCKPRDFEPCPPFILEGRPHLDITGQFLMHAKPGEAEELRSYLQQKGGRPLAPNRTEQIAMAASLRAKGDSLRDIADKLHVSKSTAARLLDEYDLGDHDADEPERKPQ